MVQAGYADRALMTPDGSRAILTTRHYDSVTQTDTTYVTIVNTDTGTRVGPPIASPGGGYVEMTSDGSRALVTFDDNNATRIQIIDTATGAQIGNTITMVGGRNYLDFIRDDSTALLQTYDSHTDTYGLTIIDTVNGRHVEETITRPGTGYAWISDDESKALFIRNSVDGDSPTTIITVVDLTSGQPVGDDITVPGTVEYRIFNDDSSRALVYSYERDPATYATTGHITLIDLTSGTQLGENITFTGSLESWEFTGDDRAILITGDYASSEPEAQLQVFDTSTGAQIGNTLHLSGSPQSVQYTADRAYVIVLTETTDAVTQRSVSTVSIVDTRTGLRVGDALTQAGAPPSRSFDFSGPRFSPDGTRAVLATSDYDASTNTGSSNVTTIAIPGSSINV